MVAAYQQQPNLKKDHEVNADEKTFEKEPTKSSSLAILRNHFNRPAIQPSTNYNTLPDIIWK